MADKNSRKKLLLLRIVTALSGLMSMPALTMQPLHEDEMGAISGQDGISVSFATPAVGNGPRIDELRWTMDAAVPTSTASLIMDTIAIDAVDSTGSVIGGVAQATHTLDVGGNGTDAAIAYGLEIDRLRIKVGALRHSASPTRSFGEWALDAEGSLRVANIGGFFNGASNTASLLGELRYGRIFYRQNSAGGPASPEMVMNELQARWEMPRGRLELNSDGLRMATGSQIGVTNLADSLINVSLDFDFVYRRPTLGNELRISGTADERGLLHFGWLGSLKDAELVWKPGGVGQGTVTGALGEEFDFSNQSEGLNFSSQWDFVSQAEAIALGDPEKEFRWRLGEASGTTGDQTRINFELGDWARWNPLNPSHYFPIIAIDAINGAGQGPGGLCWGLSVNGTSGGGACGSAPQSAGFGKQFVNVSPGTISNIFDPSLAAAGDAGGVAIIVRDGQLQSFSRRISLLERDSVGNVTTTSFNWGLIYTLNDVDANIYLYPGGTPGNLDTGIIADIAVTSQTFAAQDDPGTTRDERFGQGFNWDQGTHLMIADTDIDDDGITGENRDAMGIGLISSSFLILANDLRIWTKPHIGNDFSTGGLDLFSDEVRFNLVTTFGGGVLPDAGGGFGAGPRFVRGSLIEANLEGMLNFRLSPSSPDADNSASPFFVNASNFLGYSMAVRLRDTNINQFSKNTTGFNGTSTSTDFGSFISLAEPGRPDVDIRFANMTGDIAFTNGRIDLRGTNEDGDGRPKLVMANDILIGRAAGPRIDEVASTLSGGALPGGPGGQEFHINRVTLGGANLGRIVIPSAHAYASITLQPQQ